MHRYIPNTDTDAKKMLEAIGVSSMEDLFKDIPKELQLGRELNIEGPYSEMEIAL